MLDVKNLVALAKAAMKADKSAPVAYKFGDEEFSYDQVQATLREEMKALNSDYYTFQENKMTAYKLVAEIINEFLPKKVEGIYNMLAEIRQYPQGTKPEFKVKSSASRMRAKTFVTRVGLEGEYEVFKLGGAQTITVEATAFGGAAQVGLEEVLDGRVDLAELVDIVMEGLEDRIQEEIAKAMVAGTSQLPAANVVEWAGFDADEFDRLLKIADSYGAGKATIYCDSMFASKLIPSEINMMSDSMKEELWKNGHFAVYKMHNVVIIPNNISDDHKSLQLDPSFCYIIPGTGMKPIMIGFEGDTLVDDYKGSDWSTTVKVYKKVGVAVHFTNDICVYHDTSLSKDLVKGE